MRARIQKRYVGNRVIGGDTIRRIRDLLVHRIDERVPRLNRLGPCDGIDFDLLLAVDRIFAHGQFSRGIQIGGGQIRPVDQEAVRWGDIATHRDIANSAVVVGGILAGMNIVHLGQCQRVNVV